jgi:hypothetical protein
LLDSTAATSNSPHTQLFPHSNSQFEFSNLRRPSDAFPY